MKRFKKTIASLLLVAAMAVGLTTAAFADETKGSITIDDAVVGQTYTVYQILDLESYDEQAKAYSYKATTAWSAFVNGTDIKGVYLDVDDNGYVTWKEGADVAAFAKLAQAYTAQLDGNQGSVKATDTTVTFTDLDLGYYLVDTTLGTICSLNTTNPVAKIEEKNEVPSIDKKVQEDSNNAWGDSNDADIKQTVNFRATITAHPGAQKYVMHDKMSDGLTFDGADSVEIVGLVEGTDYTVVTEGICTDCDFHIVFSQSYLDTITKATEIVVEYSATLNENAVVGLPGNPNEVKLICGDGNETEWDKTVTYTWDAKVVKYAKKDHSEIMLAGAKFKLSSDEAGKSVLKFHSLGNNEYEMCAKVDCADGHVTEITTDATGTFHIEGLDADKYYLTEIQAPAGYNALAGPIEVVITGAAKADDGKLTYSIVEQKVENKTGTILPDTGGMGTMILYGVGALLVIGAAVLLVTRRRAGGEE